MKNQVKELAKNKENSSQKLDDESTRKYKSRSQENNQNEQKNIKKSTERESNDEKADEETKGKKKNYGDISTVEENILNKHEKNVKRCFEIFNKKKEGNNKITKETGRNKLIQFNDKLKQYKLSPAFSKALETAYPIYFLNDLPLKNFWKDLEKKKCIPKRLIDYLKKEELDISRTKCNNISKISNLSDLKDEYKGSVPHQDKIAELAKTMPFYRKIRGDGNCFYRAVIIIYLDSLFLQDVYSDKDLTEVKVKSSKVYKFCKKIEKLELLKFDDYDEREEFKKIFEETTKLKNLILTNISKLFLKKLFLQQRKKNPNNNWFKEWQEYFLETINTKPEFDVGLILLLRSMIFQKLVKNKNLKDFIIDTEGLKKKLQTYGLEAEDMIVPLSSIAMNAKVFVNMVHKDYNKNEVTLKIEEYNLGGHSKREIHILFKPGHYDAGYGLDFEKAIQGK